MKTSLPLISFLSLAVLVTTPAKVHGHYQDSEADTYFDDDQSSFNDQDSFQNERESYETQNDRESNDRRSSRPRLAIGHVSREWQESFPSGVKDLRTENDDRSLEETTPKPNIFIYLPYRAKKGQKESTTTTTTTTTTPAPVRSKWIPRSATSTSKENINRSSNVNENFQDKAVPGLATSGTRHFTSFRTRVVKAQPVHKVKLVSSPSAVQVIRSPPQQVVYLQNPPQVVQAPPAVVQQQPLFVQNPPQQVVQYVQSPPPPQPVQVVQAPPVQVVQAAPPVQHVHFVQQSPPVQVQQAPVQLVQAPPQLVQAPPPPVQFVQAPPPCPQPVLAPAAPIYEPGPPLLIPPPRPPPLVFFSPPRPQRTRTVYTQLQYVPTQTHVTTTTHFSPATRTTVFDSDHVGAYSDPRPAFARNNGMRYAGAASNQMPMSIMPPPSIMQPEMPPDMLMENNGMMEGTKPSGGGSTAQTIMNSQLGKGAVSLGEKVLGHVAEKYFERETKKKKKKIKYRGKKLLLKMLLKRKP